MAESNEVDIVSNKNNYENKTNKRLLFKNLNGAIDYLTFNAKKLLSN